MDKRYFVVKRYNIWMSEKNETLIFTFLMFGRPLLKFESYVNGKKIKPVFVHMKGINFKV